MQNNITCHCDETKPYIFFSYSHKDSEAVYSMIAELQRRGYNIWFDEGIDPGTEWDANIASHIEKAGAFLPMMSVNYLSSENCKDELNYARDCNIERVLVYLENVELPGGMKMRLSRLQAIFKNVYASEADFYAKLLQVPGISRFCNQNGEKASEPAEACAPYDRTVDASLIVSAQEAFDKGYRYYTGKNYAEAVKWYRKAAENGHADGQNNLGDMYYYGYGVAKDNAEALWWYRKAAENGNATAQYKLGMMYMIGYGIKQDYAEAVKWYKKAAAQGYLSAITQLCQPWAKPFL